MGREESCEEHLPPSILAFEKEDSISVATNENIQEDLFGGKNTTKTILKILLQDAEKHERKKKPSGIREKYFCTLNSDLVSLESCKADDNGAYSKSTVVKTLYKVEFEGEDVRNVLTCHVEESQDGRPKLFVNKRQGRTYIKEYVNPGCVFEVQRTYRYSQLNPGFVHMIVTVKRYLFMKHFKYYITAYKYEHGTEEFCMSRHGNARNPTAASYYRTDKEILNTLKGSVKDGHPVNKIYLEESDDITDSVSTTIRNPKQVYNIKENLKRKEPATERILAPEIETDNLIKQIQNSNGDYMQSLTFIKDKYYHINYDRKTLNDIERFCVHGYSVFRVDTTFEIINGYWLTDTSFSNLSLIDSVRGKNPEFPGPNMVHFRKDRETYRRFAGELLMANPKLANVKQIGTDLDSAVFGGVGDIFQHASKWKCLQHIMERDAIKLQKMNATLKQKTSILGYIYGSEQNQIFNAGLVDADSPSDFGVKLDSLEDIWESYVPGFFAWFKGKRMPLFVESVINFDLDREQLGCKFYNNRLEVLHKIQKKFVVEEGIENDVCSINQGLKDWTETYYKEIPKALYGGGKYRLAPGYDHFFVEPTKWFRWNEERQRDHINAFLSFVPKPAESYVKPKNAGLKGKVHTKSRRGDKEATLFIDPFDALNDDLGPAVAVNPTQSKVRKINPATNTNNTVEMNEKDESEDDDPLNPDRATSKVGKVYHLVHRKDKKNCPGQVVRCELCKLVFQNYDTVVVRTSGDRQWTDKKTGKQRCKAGNVYLHYLTKCLQDYDAAFRFANLVVLKQTLKKLPDSAVATFQKKGLKFEK